MSDQPAPVVPRRHVVLVGMMGSGKSTVARRLGAELGWGFVDLDEELERRGGGTVSEQFATTGEAAFRQHESQVLAEVLGSETPLVVATGGGVVVTPANLDVLAERAVVVWLRARLETLVDRLGDGAGRPLLENGDPRRVLHRLDEDRRGVYERAADAIVDVDERSPDEVVDEVQRVIAPLVRI